MASEDQQVDQEECCCFSWCKPNEKRAKKEPYERNAQGDEPNERTPLIEPNEGPDGGKPQPPAERKPKPSEEQNASTSSGENGHTSNNGKKPTKSKELKFEKFKITELDNVFDDFGRALNPFVTNRVEMETAEASFKGAVASFSSVSPKAKFGEYVHAMKTELRGASIFVKVKGGAMVLVSEAGKGIEAVRNAVKAGNQILDAAKSLEAMPPVVERASERAVSETDRLDVVAILKREFSHWSDAAKILRYKKAFTENVKKLRQAPQMVRDFCGTTREIVSEIYRAFGDEDEKYPGGDPEKSDGRVDNEQEEGARGSEKEKEEMKGEEKKGEGEMTKKDGNKDENSAKKGKKNDKAADKKDFHKKIEFKTIGVEDIDRVFADLARGVNPFVVTREAIQNAREDFEKCVRNICNFEGKREFKEYVKELKDKAKKGDITIYVDSSDGEVKITSVKGLEPPKMYRDAVKALNDLKTAGKDIRLLEPDVQNGVAACIEDLGNIDPKRDIKKGLKFKDLPKLMGKVKDLNENRKEAQQVPTIVKEFCQYLEELLTDMLEGLVEGRSKEGEEGEDDSGEGSSNEANGEQSDSGADAQRKGSDEDAERDAEEKHASGQDGDVEVVGKPRSAEQGDQEVQA